MSKHTPGPWKAVPCGGTSAVVAPTGRPSQTPYGDHGYAVGTPLMIDHGPLGERPDIAAHFQHDDARLIAAAPDMLDLIDTIENDDEKIPDWLWKQIQNVSAKAGGRWSRPSPPPSNPPGRKP